MSDPTIDRIKQQLASKPIFLYMKGTPDFPQCGFSMRTVQALRAAGATDFGYCNVLEEPDIRAGLKTYSNWPTFPQLYIKGELIGGCDIALEMAASGELKKLVDEVSAA
jgi:monothiol glutaredoxin